MSPIPARPFEPLEPRRLLTTNFPVTLGSLNADQANSVAADTTNNVYVCGTLGGTADFDPTSGTANISAGGFVARYAADGTLVWARQFIGADPRKISVDRAGNVYVAGGFSGTVDFDPRRGVQNATSVGGSDAFALKLTARGNLQFVKTFGGTGEDIATGLRSDAAGNIRVGGTFAGRANFNPNGSFRISSSGGLDGFLVGLDPSGAFQWAGSFGSSGDESLADVTIDDADNVIATGRYLGTVDFNPDHDVTDNNIAGTVDAYTFKWDSTGAFVWSHGFGGAGQDFATGVAVDRAGNVYTVGNFQDTADFDPSGATFNLVGPASGQVFVSKLNAVGNFVFAKAIGGAGTVDVGAAEVAVDKNQNVYTAGRFSGTKDFDPNGGTQNLTATGVDDVFISKLNSTGNFVFAKGFGGAGEDTPLGNTLDFDGDIIIAGAFTQTINFATGGTAINRLSNGDADVFITKLDTTGAPVT
jgi:hypothetical protein